MSELVEEAKRFRLVLDAARKDAARKSAAPEGFDWYRYNSLSSVAHLSRLLGDEHEYVLEAGRSHGILDLGCGDGDLAFFWESLGYRVTGVDLPASNQNGMGCLRVLHRTIGSNILIREFDVDSDFPLETRYGLAFCLGVLYHLRNPFFVLERLARVTQYCVLSTRIARCLPGGSRLADNRPLAYLVGEDELNGDDTNFWISEPGLRRLLERTRWEVIELFTTGDTNASDPVSPDHDERAFCLLRSHYGAQHLELQKGWHRVEDSGWRWTERYFAARAISRSPVRHSRIAMRFYVPPVLIEKFGRITPSVRINDAKLPPYVISEAGIHRFERRIPKPSTITDADFYLDQAIDPDANDDRERAIIVASLEFL